jgi:transcriptional regulator GlxA family with amidase domain
MLAEEFERRFPHIRLNTEQILIKDNDIITAGGLMSWLDLGLELVSHYSNALLMRQLGKQLIIDTAPREQRYYQSFKPKFDHGDKSIRQVQSRIQSEFHLPLSVKSLADRHHMSERTLLRRFVDATGYKPKEYLQRLRVQKACDLLESTRTAISEIAHNVGYEDISAFRKVFVQITGLSPREFRQRFL